MNGAPRGPASTEGADRRWYGPHTRPCCGKKVAKTSCVSSERLALLLSGYRVRTIDILDQSQLLHELRQIYLGSSGLADLPSYSQFKRGRRIRVVRDQINGLQMRNSSRKRPIAWCSTCPLGNPRGDRGRYGRCRTKLIRIRKNPLGESPSTCYLLSRLCAGLESRAEPPQNYV